MGGIIEVIDSEGLRYCYVELKLVEDQIHIQQKSVFEHGYSCIVKSNQIKEINLGEEEGVRKVTLTLENQLIHIVENGSVFIPVIANFILKDYFVPTGQLV